MTMRQQKIPIEALERIDDLCADFEKQWQANNPPSIESTIAGESEELQRGALLAELIVLDVDYRRRRGDTPAEQEYLDRFPADAENIRVAFHETGRQKAFEPPTTHQLAALFPSLDIIELIGSGGMGAVYKARQRGLDRIVALKVLPAEFGHDVKFALRFTREARTLAKLNHPNIVGLYEFGSVDETYYFLMEYIEGATLRDAVAARELSSRHALHIVPHLCDALQYAHDQGVIHRDIKPENILMDVNGAVKIADFGLSRILGTDGQQPPLTATHQVMGTPRYMAPEQLEGAHNVDHRADIYSLGVVIYEMLTGELPIGRFAAPSKKVAIDVRLDEVVLRTLEKEPQRRYQQASQIKSDVQSITSSENPGYAPTEIEGTAATKMADRESPSLHDQDVAARLLISRRQLMERVKGSLRPLLRGQLIQIAFGVILILLGALCWSQNIGNTGHMVSGLIVHIYGIVVIGTAANVLTKMRLVDYSKSLDEIRGRLDRVRVAYLPAASVVGFIWWLMWIPLCVVVGFDQILMPQPLILSLVVGVIGLGASLWLYRRMMKSADPDKQRQASGSIVNAFLELDQIELANIR